MIPCTSCGGKMWASRTTAAEPRCLPCRRSAPGYSPARKPVGPKTKACIQCQSVFTGPAYRDYCSARCRLDARNKRRRESAPNAIPEIVLNGMAYRFGAFAPKQKAIKCRVPVGVMAFCPNCGAVMGGISPEHRVCRSCATEVRFNIEEIEAACAGLIR